MSMKRILSLLLMLMMVLTTASAEIPAYLNVGKTPLVNEDVTLRVAVMCHDNTTEPEGLSLNGVEISLYKLYGMLYNLHYVELFFCVQVFYFCGL